MNDKTLLELAAKASGFGGGSFIWCEAVLRNDTNAVITEGGLWGYTDNRTLWNPLTNDGDALRLAVKLDINIDFVDKCAWKRHRGKLIQEYWGGDYDPSYKHAIVGAAAAIAEQGEK